MVVGHQHLQTQGLCRLNTCDAGNAVVHSDQHIRPLRMHTLGNRRGQAITIHHPIGHQIADMLGAQHAQAAHCHGAGCGAIAVVVSHHAQALVLGHGIGQ